MKRICLLLVIGFPAAVSLQGQGQTNYTGVNVTGQLVLARTVNMLQQAQLPHGPLGPVGREAPNTPVKLLAPEGPANLPALPSMQSLTVSPAFSGFGFNALSHLEQRQSNGGNQFSIEPPSPSIAVGNGLILEGVNNAIQVYSLAGTPLLPQAVASNQVFGLAPAIIRTTNIHGPTLTDMRVFYDQGINRWFIVQRSQDSDTAGNFLNHSHLFIAASQTADPAGTYNIYSMDTTNSGNSGCPCLPDFPQLGADQYGFYVSVNEYNTAFNSFVDATILAISKTSLAAGAGFPTAFRVLVPHRTGYEFTIQPATTPPGASYFLGNNGLEYFVSSIPTSGNNLAIWALTNTSSLDTMNPKPVLSEIVVPSLAYIAPGPATQRPGPLPYGSTLVPPGLLANIDGADSRVLSVSYAGGRLYVTLATQVVDESSHRLVGGAYAIFSPTFRGGVLAAFNLRQGYLMVSNNHLLRPAIAVNPQGQGAIVVTLVGPDYFPSAALVAIETLSTASTLQIAGPGSFPEDGFTGYPGGIFPQVGLARWGDYSSAVASTDGSIWLATEYIPNAPRTDLANWGTFLIRYTK